MERKKIYDVNFNLLFNIQKDLNKKYANDSIYCFYYDNEKFKAQALNDFFLFSIVAAASLFAGILHHKFGWQFVNYLAIPAVIGIIISLVWLYKIDKIKHIQPDSEMINDATNTAES